MWKRIDIENGISFKCAVAFRFGVSCLFFEMWLRIAIKKDSETKWQEKSLYDDELACTRYEWLVFSFRQFSSYLLSENSKSKATNQRHVYLFHFPIKKALSPTIYSNKRHLLKAIHYRCKFDFRKRPSHFFHS